MCIIYVALIGADKIGTLELFVSKVLEDPHPNFPPHQLKVSRCGLQVIPTLRQVNYSHIMGNTGMLYEYLRDFKKIVQRENFSEIGLEVNLLLFSVLWN